MVTCDWSPRCTEAAEHRVEKVRRPGLILNVCEEHMGDAEWDGYRRSGPAESWWDDDID